MKTLFSTRQAICSAIFALFCLFSVSLNTLQAQKPKETIFQQPANQQNVPQVTPPQSPSTQATVSNTAAPIYPREAYTFVPVNIGFVPPLSIGNIVQASTGKRVVSNISFHFLGNVSNALEGVEWSGIWNVQSDYVLGVQAAGIVNIVGGNAGYAQGAGIGNIVGGKFEGGQGAGIFNIAEGGLAGVQGAGIFNITGNADGVQGAGIFNSADNLRGVQGAGIVNFADNVQGGQWAGIGNFARDVEGVQFAAIFNSAKKVRGVQVGLVNIAEDNEDVMIGLVNFNAKHGIRIEMATDEMRFIRAGLRTGNKAWYSLFTGGLQPFTGVVLWSVGYGLGTQLYLGQRDYIDFSLHTETMFNTATNRGIFVNAQAGRLRVLFGHDFAPRFSVFLGPTLNIMAGVENNPVYELATNLFPGGGYIATANNINWNGIQNAWLRSWVGITGGFRF